MLFWLILPQMNIPTKDNVSNEAIVQVMLENDTIHYDTDHDDTHASNNVWPNATRSRLRCTALPALTRLPPLTYLRRGVMLPRLPLGMPPPPAGARHGVLLCAEAFSLCSGGCRTPNGANSRRFRLRRGARARAVRYRRKRSSAEVTA